MSDDKKPIGRILLKRKLISQDELERQLNDQARTHDGVPLASRVAESGIASEVDVLRALAEQFGVPGIDLQQVAIASDHLRLVPYEVAESSHILPVLAREDQIFLAMANPLDQRVIDELEFITGRRVYPYVAISTALERAIKAAYAAKERGDAYYVGPNAPDETLERLGLPKAKTAPPPPLADVPEVASIYAERRFDEGSDLEEFSTNDFGTVSEEVSRLALLTEEEKVASNIHAVRQGHTGKRVLVVDDEEDIRKLVRRLLTAEGHDVIEADRGLVALRVVKEHVPDLIVLDAMLPELHGFDIARRIKGSEKYGSIPVLMMSAVYRGWRIAEDLKTTYGVEDYIEKPFHVKDLVTRVTRLLARSDESAPAYDPERMDRDAARYLEEGIAAYRADEIERATELLRKGIAVDPLAYRLRYHLALIYGKLGQIYDGITELERAVDLNPKHFPALKNLAVLYEKAGFRNKAVEMWERCVPIAPDPETRESIKTHVFKLL